MLPRLGWCRVRSRPGANEAEKPVSPETALVPAFAGRCNRWLAFESSWSEHRARNCVDVTVDGPIRGRPSLISCFPAVRNDGLCSTICRGGQCSNISC